MCLKDKPLGSSPGRLEEGGCVCQQESLHATHACPLRKLQLAETCPLPLLFPLPHLHLLHSALLFDELQYISCQVTFLHFKATDTLSQKCRRLQEKGNLLGFIQCRHGPSVISKQYGHTTFVSVTTRTTLPFPKYTLDVFFGEVHQGCSN